MPAVKSFKTKVIESGLWSFLNYAVSQGLRFAGNLLLTRLLFPEAFGLAAVVQTVILGVTLLSDVGIRNSIIQHPDGDDPNFLNTCWSMQIIQGFLVFAIIILLSPVAAKHFNQPELPALLAVAGLGTIFGAFTSTKLITANRKLDMKLVALIEMGSYILGLIIMLILAYYLRSVYALVLGSIITSLSKTLMSHICIQGPSNRFHIDKSKLKAILNIGKWVFISTAISFFAGEGSKLFVASNMDMANFGMFNLANAMIIIIWSVASSLTNQTFFPILSELYRTDKLKFMRILYKSKLLLMSIGWTSALVFVFFGQEIMNIFYDERYSTSGEMLEILALGYLCIAIHGSYSVALIAMGEFKFNSIIAMVDTTLQLISILIGYHYGGALGIIYGLTLAKWLIYPIWAYAYYKKEVLLIKLDLAFLSASAVVTFIYITYQY